MEKGAGGRSRSSGKRRCARFCAACGVVLATLLAGWVATMFLAGGASLMKPTELAGRLSSGEKFLIVDLRDPADFAAGHLEGALNLPADTPFFMEVLNAAGQERQFVLMAAGDKRVDVKAAANRLARKWGFDHVAVLRGSLADFQGAGLTVTR